ncbi:MAG: sulfurtransferase-like selenium metabolism protein YedF [Oscillospiraceae bacterium]
MKILDAVGKQCPIPVIMSKKEVKEGTEQFNITVDNEFAVENLRNFALTVGYTTTSNNDGNNFVVHFNKVADATCECACCHEIKNWALFVGKDTIGDGEKELGTNLIRMFFYTLKEDADIPKYILFMNSGVFLATMDEQIVEHLKALEERGTEILICGTCLNFYKIQVEPQVGKISNMYDISDKMKIADKVITL